MVASISLAAAISKAVAAASWALAAAISLSAACCFRAFSLRAKSRVDKTDEGSDNAVDACNAGKTDTELGCIHTDKMVTNKVRYGCQHWDG